MSRRRDGRERGLDADLVGNCTGRFSPLLRGGGVAEGWRHERARREEGINGMGEKGKRETGRGGDGRAGVGGWRRADEGGTMEGGDMGEGGWEYIPSSIHSAENHRGTFRGAPTREDEQWRRRRRQRKP